MNTGTDRGASSRLARAAAGEGAGDGVTGDIDFGYATRAVRERRYSQLVPVRAAVVAAGLGVLAIVLAVIGIGFGDYPLSVAQVVQALFGQGEEFHQMIVMEWRLPVAVAALVFGCVLGIGGAIFQSLTRNPLGSPDVIGFDAGSYTAVVVTMLVIGTGSYWMIAGAALAGGILTALVVYLLAYRRGIQGFRLIVVGIGVAAMLGSANAYLITRADIEDAMAVGFWGAGSLSRVSWSSMGPSLIIAAVIVVLAVASSPVLRQLELGDDAALAQGVDVRRSRLALIIVGVATTVLVTAAAGPIGFIALAAPQLARRVTHSSGTSILPAAVMGAALLTFAHVLSLVIASIYRAVPVGLITVSVGGLYLIWLLIAETRRQYGKG